MTPHELVIALSALPVPWRWTYGQARRHAVDDLPPTPDNVHVAFAALRLVLGVLSQTPEPPDDALDEGQQTYWSLLASWLGELVTDIPAIAGPAFAERVVAEGTATAETADSLVGYFAWWSGQSLANALLSWLGPVLRDPKNASIRPQLLDLAQTTWRGLDRHTGAGIVRALHCHVGEPALPFLDEVAADGAADELVREEAALGAAAIRRRLAAHQK